MGDSGSQEHVVHQVSSPEQPPLPQQQPAGQPDERGKGGRFKPGTGQGEDGIEDLVPHELHLHVHQTGRSRLGGDLLTARQGVTPQPPEAKQIETGQPFQWRPRAALGRDVGSCKDASRAQNPPGLGEEGRA